MISLVMTIMMLDYNDGYDNVGEDDDNDDGDGDDHSSHREAKII